MVDGKFYSADEKKTYKTAVYVDGGLDVEE